MLLYYIAHDILLNVIMLFYYIAHDIILNVIMLFYYITHDIILNVIMLLYYIAHDIILNVIMLLYYIEIQCNIIFLPASTPPCNFFLDVFRQKLWAHSLFCSYFNNDRYICACNTSYGSEVVVLSLMQT
jgi:hypothetical protein